MPVVTVTYSPGPHLGRFLASLSHATERPVSVLMADNGSTDGAPQAAVERYPGVRLFSTGSNLGYGSAVNRAVAELGDVDEWIIVANPDVQWGPGSIDALLDAATRWPRAATLGPLVHDPDGSVYPSARQLPSLVRGGMHAVVGPLWKKNPWSAAYRQERLEPSERPVGWLSGSCLLVRRAAFEQIGGFDERYFMYMEDVDLGDRLETGGLAQRLRALSGSAASQRPRDRARVGAQSGGASQKHLHLPRRPAFWTMARSAAPGLPGRSGGAVAVDGAQFRKGGQ